MRQNANTDTLQDVLKGIQSRAPAAIREIPALLALLLASLSTTAISLKYGPEQMVAVSIPDIPVTHNQCPRLKFQTNPLNWYHIETHP